jgi:hypothetical protein
MVGIATHGTNPEPVTSVVPALELEQYQLLSFDPCPFRLPDGSDREFLLTQRVAPRVHKNISYDPNRNRLGGARCRSPRDTDRLRELLGAFSREATAWLARLLPAYASGWAPDRASLRPHEEATRVLRLTARNDLLHVDNFPTRPSRGRRILRLFVNLDPSEPRVWVTSEAFPVLLERFASRHGLPRPGSHVGRGCPDYDRFMRRLHHFLKLDDRFQERAPKRRWLFPPGSAWLLFADALSHAVLRGRLALEHSYFVPVERLLRPELAPVRVLRDAGPRAGAGMRAAG